jgi:hypothetical protein
MFWNKKKKEKIGVLYICTGKYDIYWEQFLNSSETYFCPKIEKHYFIFTDSHNIQAADNITIIPQERLGWPDDTLMRFHMFNRIKDLLTDFDYLFFLNANMQFRKKITPKQILPTSAEGLVAVIHPYYYESPIGAPFEEDKNSLAYVNSSAARHYVQGCLNGGTSKEYLCMSAELAANIDQDKANGIIAVWHDESHLNAYLVKHPSYKALNAGYAKPEGREGFPFKEKVVILNKNNQGGLAFLRS